MVFNRLSIFILLVILCPAIVNAQSFSDRLKAFVSSDSFPASGIKYPKEVREFYGLNGHGFSWLTKQNSSNLTLLAGNIQSAETFGLAQGDYQPGLLKAYRSAQLPAASEYDSLVAEIQFTDAAIHFLHDLMLGNKTEPLGYHGVKYSPSCYNIPALLNAYLSFGRFPVMMAELEPRQAEYLAVRSKLNLFQRTMAAAGFKDAVVKTSKILRTNKALLTRLYQLGFLPSDTLTLSEAAVKTKLKEAQNLFSLLSDGALRSTIVQALNVPLHVRVTELKITLNSIRWLHCIKQEQHVVMVNIPSATLLLYEHGKVVMESRIIVGKRSTPTPTLSSTITEVILYPYWNVPYKIATKELLPYIKRNPGYLNANNYQVLNSNGKVVNPGSVNWSALGPGNFPYTIRQSTGCDNALGLIKLNFYNPFTVYLHDTPGKSLFGLNKRYFSHGCMRVEKAMNLGRYILKDNSIAIDTLTEKGCLKNLSPIVVPATEKIPVFVLYHTAWIDSAATLRFYEDVYNKLAAIKR
ncbi:MAG: L,D-transpeptidase family protein [Ferruginibacter sp.]|nr:L,D-transpeptidase family protein [Ferruginibacter sp.]